MSASSAVSTNSLHPPARPIEAPRSPALLTLTTLIRAIATTAFGFLGAILGLLLTGDPTGIVIATLITTVAGIFIESYLWPVVDPKLLAFYQEKGILNDCKKPLEVDLD